VGWAGGAAAAAVARGAIDEVRSYCECDVLNTYLLYQRFRLMRGELTAGGYAAEISLAREKVAATGAPHWRAFLAAWDANATAPAVPTGA
jgi:predicted PolB exonuclease-like 3'-5' exonuclease